jgi:hypothetical protein
MERYNAKPIHLYTYAIPLLLAGSIVFALDWVWLGITLFGFGILMGLWVVLAGLTEQYTSYCDSRTELVRILEKTNNPEVWAALGLEPPSRVEPKWLPTEPDAPPGELHQSLFHPNVTGPRFTQFVDGILQGKSLAETEWSPRKSGKLFSSAEYRALKGELRKHKLIRAVSASNALLGDCLTKKGRTELLAYASPGVRDLLEHHYVNSPPLLKSEGGLLHE